MYPRRRERANPVDRKDSRPAPGHPNAMPAPLPEPRAVEPSLVGRTLGRYRFVERIGAGGMGVVYRAWDERLGRDVALKVLGPSARGGERLAREALTLSRLDHPAIATLFDLDRDDGTEFFVQEFVRGVTIADRLARGPLPETEVLALAVQAADALAAAHEQGVIHRDLKPANVMVTVRGHVKLLDFGLAGFVAGQAADADRPSRRAFDVGGTLPYAAPEQLLGQPVDARSDLFAFGVLLYEMATGRVPFTGAVEPAVIDAIFHQSPAPPRRLRPEVSPGLEALILSCLEKRAEERPASAAAVAAALRTLAGGEGALLARPRPAPAPASNPAARQAYELGRRQWAKRTAESLRLAIEHFERAIDADPSYAPAYSGLADGYNILAPWLPPRLAYRKAKAAARRAIELAPDLAEAHVSLAFATFYDDWDWAACEAGYRRAIALDPAYATGHQWYAEFLATQARFDEAVDEARAAEDLDPLSWAMPTSVINVFYYARRFAEALEHHRRMLAVASSLPGLGGIADRARILEQSGRAVEAVVEYERVLALDDDPRIRAGYACALALSGRTSDAREQIAQLEPVATAYALAAPLALTGDKARALAMLERGFAERDRAMVYVRVNPRFDPLRDEPRYAEVLRRMRLAD